MSSGIQNFFSKFGGSISITVVVGFALALILGDGPGALSRPLHDYSIMTKVIWGVFIFFALLAVIFKPPGGVSRSFDFIEEWGALIALALLLIFPFFTGYSIGPAKDGSGPPIAWLRVSVVVGLTFFLIVPVAWRFLYVFTRPVKGQPEAQVREIVRAMVRFCYVFMLIALFVSFLPPFIMGIVYLAQTSAPKVDAKTSGVTGDPKGLLPHSDSTADPTLTSVFYKAMVDSPVGLVRGCVHAPKEPDWELACRFPEEAKDGSSDIYAAQWMFNIGGSAQRRTSDQNASTPMPLGGTNPALSESPAAGVDSAPTPTPPADARTDVEPELVRPLFYPVTIHGGLAVPWYFIMLAVMGAAVSMARRVPEYQRRVAFSLNANGEANAADVTKDPKSPPPKPKAEIQAAHAPQTDGDPNAGTGKLGNARSNPDDNAKAPEARGDPDDLSPTRVREFLVFQVLQVLSAPLIAITAYNALTPSSRAASVALAFVSGFSSESVLLAIRSFADKIQPEQTPTEKK
jgi:hypothetical protein